jgi:hypothetical protein
MNQVLRVPNLVLDIPRGTKQRAKLAGPPANERRLILPFKLMPAKSRLLQLGHHIGAFGCCGGSQRSLLDPNDLQPIPGWDCHRPSATNALS